VGPNGYIEKVRENLQIFSEDFTDVTGWAKDEVTASANQTTAPDGQTTADELTETTSNTAHWSYTQGGVFTTTIGVDYTFSVFAKKGDGSAAPDIIQLTFRSAGHGISQYANFNLSTGVVTASTGGTASIVSKSNGWYLISFTATATISAASSGGAITFTNNNPTATRGPIYVGNTNANVFVWGAQLEVSDFGPTEYIKTEAAAVSVGPVSGTPRLDYLGSDCGRLLLEPQRSNLYTFSEQLNQWTAVNATITANDSISPDGYTNADRVQFIAGGLVYISGTGSAGENTLSVYAKAKSGTSAQFRFFANGATTESANQTATDQWQRFTFTYTYSAVTAGLTAPSTGASDVLFWGFQHEVGAYATSYIPTLGTAVTRVADAASRTSASALIGQTEGTFVIDIIASSQNADAGGAFSVLFTAGVAGDNFQIYTAEKNLRFYKEPSSIDFYSSVNLVEGQRYKIGYAYKAGDYAFYVNGVQVGTSTNASVPAVSSIYINQFANGTYQAQNRFNQVLFFKTRLTNAQLAELTSL
jgi:hypothetical protein